MNNIETPCFIIDERELSKNIDSFYKALDEKWGNSIIGYSFKTNSLPWVLNYCLEKKCYAEVVSSDEYNLALHMGYKKENIIFNGPVKGKEEFIDAIRNNSIVNIDSKREVEWIRELAKETNGKIKIGIRANFDLEEVCPGEVGYEEDGTRFGFSIENGDFYRTIKKLEEIENVEVNGIHLHNTSKTRSLNIYRELSKKACEIKKETGINFEFVDIGGGFFGGLPEKPSFDEYVEVIASELKKEYNPRDTVLIVEPGSSIIASPVSFISDVIDVKDTIKSRIVTLNASRTNIDPLNIKHRYFYEINSSNEKTIDEQIICGFTCMDTDRIMKLDDEKELHIGDKVIFNNVGSYTMSLNPLFINFFPKVYLYNGGSYKCIREKWGVKEFVQKS